MVRVAAEGDSELHHQHDVVTATVGEGRADDLLGLTGGVAVSGVDEGDPGVESPPDDAYRVVVVSLPNAPNIIRPSASWLTNMPVTKRAVLHGGTSFGPSATGGSPDPSGQDVKGTDS